MVTASQVDRALDEAFQIVFGVKRPNGPLTQGKSYNWSRRELQGYAQRGMTARDVADALGLSKVAVKSAALRYGVTLRSGKAGRPRKVGI